MVDFKNLLASRGDCKSEVLGSRVSASERRVIEAAAAGVHATVSDFIRAASVAIARDYLAGDSGAAR
ncbi:MAG: hypothetical protein Q7S20_01265 [Gemmatimonadaceae bacterium]|nr:hypothetical protein [Gemmatimonadaceae bacterium]